MTSRACSTRDALVLAKLRVLVGEPLAQLAGARIDDVGRGEVDTQFRRARPDGRLVAENGQLGHRTLQQPPGRPEDAVVVALGQDDASAVGPRPVLQLVGEHLRRDHRWAPKSTAAQ